MSERTGGDVGRRLARHLVRALAMLVCVGGVPVLVTALIWWCYGVPLSEFRPYINDEVTYWHQALTFSRAGFQGGYYTAGEVTNASGFTPFGPHGPGFPVIYGAIGAAIGWHLPSVVAANLALVALAAWWCVTVAGLNPRRATLLGGLLLTFWPLVLWAPTGMQESLHHAGAIAMAGCVARVLAQPDSAGTRAAGWVTLSVLSFVRPSWLVLMPVWALASSWHGRPRLKAATLAAAVLVSGLVFAAYTRSTAPFVPGFFFLRAASASVGLQAVWHNLVANLGMTAALGEYEPLEVLQRLQYWAWLPASGVLAVLAARRRAPGSEARRAVPFLLAGFGAMAAALAFLLLLYTLTNWAEHRVLSAFLLFAAVLGVCAPGRAGPALAAALIVSNLAMAGPFLSAFKEERQENFVWDHRGLREFEAAIAGRVVFRPGQPRWCNTLLTSQYPPYLAAIPAGIGISVVREPDQMTGPPRSRYLLLDAPALADFRYPLRSQALAALPYGTLYLNLEADCP